MLQYTLHKICTLDKIACWLDFLVARHLSFLYLGRLVLEIPCTLTLNPSSHSYRQRMLGLLLSKLPPANLTPENCFVSHFFSSRSLCFKTRHVSSTPAVLPRSHFVDFCQGSETKLPHLSSRYSCRCSSATADVRNAVCTRAIDD